MAGRKWFVLTDEGEMGPLGPNGLRKLVADGTIHAGTLLRREDRDRSIRAERIAGLILPEDPPELEEWTEPADGSHQHRSRLHRPALKLRGEYRPLSGYAIAATCLVGLSGAIGTVECLNLRIYAEQLAAGAAAATEAEATAALLSTLSIFQWLAIALAAVGAIAWLYRARLNVPALLACHPTLAPSWAIAGWFVPFLNLVRPYQVVGEVYDLSAAAAAHVKRLHPRHWLLGLWWMLFLLPFFALAAVHVAFDDAATITSVSVWARLGWIASSGLFIVIAWNITVRQSHAAHDLIESGEMEPLFGKKPARAQHQTA